MPRNRRQRQLVHVDLGKTWWQFLVMVFQGADQSGIGRAGKLILVPQYTAVRCTARFPERGRKPTTAAQTYPQPTTKFKTEHRT